MVEEGRMITMYIKLYYSTENDKKIESLRAVDYQDKSITINLDKFIGEKLSDNLKRQVSKCLKGYFVTNWVLE